MGKIPKTITAAEGQVVPKPRLVHLAALHAQDLLSVTPILLSTARFNAGPGRVLTRPCAGGQESEPIEKS